MLTYKNILIAVDGSHEAEWAFNKAVDVAKRNDAQLTIVNIIDSRTYSSYEVYDAQFTEKSKGFSDELLKGYKEVASRAGVTNVETRLEFGSPKAIIPKKLANELGVDLIMCGTSSDLRDLLGEAANGDERAELALDIFASRIHKYIGSYAARMHGVDAVSYTHLTMPTKRIV